MTSHFETTPVRDPAEYSSRTLMWLLGNMILIPVNAFIYGMEMLVRTMHGIQNATDRGLGIVAGGNSRGADTTVAAGSENVQMALGTAAEPNTNSISEIIAKESVKMPDTN